ncbi:MAG TPA: type 1 glutamine amidotransferase [Usitatibacter sp.]
MAMDPLKIGVSARLLYPDPSRTFLPTKSVQYLEQSAANWVMSGEVLTFMIPELTIATPHMPKTLRARDYVNALDGLLLQGGADMSPRSYGEAPINPKRWGGDEVRDQYEIELFREFVEQGKPVFGICRGHQVINVALGGKLFQDLATQRGDASALHRDDTKYDHNFHSIRILAGTWLSRIYPGVNSQQVNSIHHQAIKELANGLVAEAMSEPDGIIEAVRWEGPSFVMGVQWHPEFVDPANPALIDSRPLLAAFLSACELRRRTGKASPVTAIKAA